MLLNQTVVYAFRCLAVLAGAWPDRRLTSRQLAREANVPAAYVSKVMRRLVLAELADGVKGHHGGFLLLRDPRRTRFIEVLDAMEFGIGPNECAFGIGKCNPSNPCSLHDAWQALQEGFERWARTNSLSDSQAALGEIISLEVDRLPQEPAPEDE